jgi:hypothetical protein
MHYVRVEVKSMTMVSERMPRTKSVNTVQLVVRVPEEWLTRFDALLPWLAQPGVATTRTDAVRAALSSGLDALEAKRAAEDAKPPKARR